MMVGCLMYILIRVYLYFLSLSENKYISLLTKPRTRNNPHCILTSIS